MVPEMDENSEPLEHKLAREKAIRNEDRRIDQAGFGASDLGLHGNLLNFMVAELNRAAGRAPHDE
jgi:hypothetical protein